MFCDQISCIISNTSTIDKLKIKRDAKNGKSTPEEKAESSNKRTWWQNICEVMSGDYSEGISIHWALPTDIKHLVMIEREYK